MITYRIKDYVLDSLQPQVNAIAERLNSNNELEDLDIERKTKKVINASDYFFDKYIKDNINEYSIDEMINSFEDYYKEISDDIFYETYKNCVKELGIENDINIKNDGINKLSDSEIQKLDDGLFATFNGVTDFHPVTERVVPFCGSSRDVYRVNLHDNIKVVQYCAFYDNSKLRDVLFPASMLMTEARSFASCNIHTIIAEGKPFYIDEGTFYNNQIEKFFVKPEHLNDWKEYLKENEKLLETFFEKDIEKLVESYTSLHYIYQTPTLTQYLQMENRVKEFNIRIAPIVSDIYNNIKNEKETKNMTRGTIIDEILKATENEYDRYMRYDYPRLDPKPDIVSSFIERMEDKSANIYSEVSNHIKTNSYDISQIMNEDEIEKLAEIRSNNADFDEFEEEELDNDFDLSL